MSPFPSSDRLPSPETYRIDKNCYPPTALHSQGGRAVDYPNGFVCGDGGGWLLTTPVAYITPHPRDPFPDFQGWSYTNPKGMQDRPLYYDCFEKPESNSLFFNPVHGRPGAGDPERAMGLVWAMVSPRPTSRTEVPGSEGDNAGWYFYAESIRSAFPSAFNPYDPTNGTRSVGAFTRYSSGEINYRNPE